MCGSDPGEEEAINRASQLLHRPNILEASIDMFRPSLFLLSIQRWVRSLLVAITLKDVRDRHQTRDKVLRGSLIIIYSHLPRLVVAPFIMPMSTHRHARFKC